MATRWVQPTLRIPAGTVLRQPLPSPLGAGCPILNTKENLAQSGTPFSGDRLMYGIDDEELVIWASCPGGAANAVFLWWCKIDSLNFWCR